MPQTPMKARLAAGETLFGSFLTLGSPLAAEAMGLAGFDWLLVDLEHGGGHESQALAQFIGVQNAGVHALARVESDARSRAGRLLDLGAEGLMCPSVNTPEQAERWIAALHYAPHGNRGSFPFFNLQTGDGDVSAVEKCNAAEHEEPKCQEVAHA